VTNARTAFAATSLPPTSLIICSRNRPQLLLESVQSVLAGDEVPTELLIMDQSDQPHSVLASLTSDRGCLIRYQQTDTVGECPARNAGIRLARHDLLVFTDDDVAVTSTWFGALVRALLGAGPKGVVTGRVLASVESTPGGFAPAIKVDEMPAVYQGRPGEDVLFPMNMAMFRSTIDDIGDFDVRFGAGGPFRGAEDNDFGYRLLEAGYRILYTPEAMLYHRAWRRADEYLPLRWNYAFCQGAFYAKYFTLSDPYMLRRMWADLARHGSRLVRYGWRRSLRQNTSDVIYIIGLLYGVTQWLLTQPKSPASAGASS